MSTEEEWGTAAPTIDEWKKRARIAAHGHRLALKRSADWHRWRGAILVLLSTLLASSLIGKVEAYLPNHPNKVAFAKLSLALAVALISAYQAYAAADQAAQKHDSLRAEYSSTCRDIEATMALPVSQRGSLSEFLKRTGEKLNALSHANFHIPEKDYARATKEQKA